MELLAVFAITFFVGPGMFYLLSKVRKNGKTFPSSLTGAIGDTIFLPLFNTVAVYDGIAVNPKLLLFSLTSTVLFSSFYLFYRIRFNKAKNWMYNKDGNFNLIGQYHFGFVIVESFIIFYSLGLFYNYVAVWLILLGYLITVFFSKRKNRN